MVAANPLECPDCKRPLLEVFRAGFFCRHCQIAISISDGWAHILGPSLSERRIRLLPGPPGGPPPAP